MPTAIMSVVILSGGLSDKADYHGLASFTASLLTKGTLKRTGKDISQQIAAMGGSLEAQSGLSDLTSVVSARGFVENLDQTIDILADVLRNPAFPGEEVENFKERMLVRLQTRRSSPDVLAQEQLSRAIYGSHPASLVELPADSIRKLSPKDLSDFHSTYYRPNNAILAIAGDITLNEVLPKIEKTFGGWQRADVPPMTIQEAPPQTGARIFLIDRPGSVQTVLRLGNLGIERTSPDFPPLLLANRILGGGAAARLFLNLREDKGYTYGAYSSFDTPKFRGTWVSRSAVRTEVTAGAMHEFMYELKRLRNEKVSAGELDDAKRAVIGNLALSLEGSETLLNNVITQKLYNFPSDYWDTYPYKIAAVTADDIQRVAQKYIDLDQLQIIAVGDASKLLGVLAKYGKVEVSDVDGRPVPPLDMKKN